MGLKHVQKSFLILLVGIFFISGCIEQQPTEPPSEKIIFTLPAELPEATEGAAYSYSFCEPDSARSGATCGALAGATTNPAGGEPPYSFSVQFGSGFIPPGLALELNGLLGGTPTLPGKYPFGICVKDRQEEVCKTTSLTVKPKSEQPMEKATVTIESASCTKTYDIGVKQGPMDWGPWNIYELRASGTVTGPPGAEFSVVTNPITGDRPQASCTTWGPSKLQTCARGSGTSSSSWSLVVSNIKESGALQQTRYTIDVEAYVFAPGEYGGSSLIAKQVTSVTCPR